MQRSGRIPALASLSSDGKRPLRSRCCLVDAIGQEASFGEQCEHRRLLHQEPPGLDFVCGRSNQGDALVDPAGQEISTAQEPGGLRTKEREVCLARDAACPFEYGARGIDVAPDEGAVPQADAGRSQAVRTADAFGEFYCPAAGVDALLELSEVRETACEPGQSDCLEPRPGPA